MWRYLVVMDVFVDSCSCPYDEELCVDEKKFLNLRARSAELTFCGCAHAAFVCELAHSLKSKIRSYSAVRDSSGGDGDLCVGILGLGHLGKQLLISLLKKTSIKTSNIKVSTRNPESAEDCVPAGVECFFDNHRLAMWADVLFLCCLPSHLPRICSDFHSHLSKQCLVYSFTSAVPVTRVAELLRHDFVLKPQYESQSCGLADVWLSCSHLTTASVDPSLIEASCPLTMKGGLNWICGVLYSLLNNCTSACLGSSEALSLINSVFIKEWMNNEHLNAKSFISSSCASVLHPDEPFPWISLTAVQLKETPLLRCLSASKSIQQCISEAYRTFLERP